MSTTYRRYEILLPRRYNNGQRIPSRLLTETIVELRERLGAVSCETQVIQGQWRQEGDVFHDELVRLFVDVEDDAASRDFFLELKERLKNRFQQLDIWLTSHPIDVL